MISMAFKRVSEELLNGAAYGIDLKMADCSWNELEAVFQGPSDSPYAEGTFVISLKVPEVFPFQPPKVKFITRIWHPNVSAGDGSMCDDFLRDWPASMTIRGLCIFIQSLLLQPDLEKPICPVAAQQLVNTPLTYTETAKYWTKCYARGLCLDREFTSELVEKESKVLGLFYRTERPIEEIRIALSVADWNYGLAFEFLNEPSPPSPFAYIKEEPEDEDRKSISLDNLPAEALEGVVRVIIGTEDESEGELSEISSLAGSYYMDDYDNCVYDDDDGSFIDDMDSSGH